MKITRILRTIAALGAVALGVNLVGSPTPSANAMTARQDESEARIASTCARVFDRSHFLGERFDDVISEKFFDNYLKALDPGRLHLLQSDEDELAVYRDRLDDLTLGDGDTSPAIKIYARFVERLEQRIAFAKEMLSKDPFDFSGNETWRPDRDREPRPKDINEAHGLWRTELRNEYLQEKLAGKGPAEIVRTLGRRYDRISRTAKEIDRNDIIEIYLNALAHAYDPHSDYMGPRQMEDFSIQMNLKLCGIGATLQSDDGFCKIKELIAGGPAARSGLLHPGDRIVAVQQDGGEEPEDIVDMPLHKAVELIRGPKGTRVRLTLIPSNAADDSARKTIALVRDEIKLEEQEAKARIVDMPWDGGHVRLGVIDLPAFYADMDGHSDVARKSATGDVARLVNRLITEGIEGLVLDLRRNGGGSLDEAIGIAGLFLPTGPIVQTKDAAGRIQVGCDTDPRILFTGPMVVLTSRLSASASEIVAGALQDHGRALVVGDSSTFGKGTVQSLVPLAELMKHQGSHPSENPGSLKITVAKFYRPGGASTQWRGVVPDIVLPSPTDVAKIAESEMDNAMPWDAVAPARYEPLNLVGPFLPALRARSAGRLEADPEFTWIRADAATLQKKLANPEVSLNAAERIKEKKSLEAQAETRKRELAKLRKNDETTYLIKGATAGQRGLPAPEPKQTMKNDTDPKNGDDTSGALADEPPSGTDPVLAETEHILADYIGLARRPLPKDVVRTSGQERLIGSGG